MIKRHSKVRARLLFGLTLSALLSACASAPQSAALRQQTPPEFTAPVLLRQVPFYPQELYQCGPAALATLLGASGVQVSPEQLVPLVYVPEREGSFQVEMVATTRSHGRLAYRIAPTLDALLSEVAAGHPVLVLQNLALDIYPRWHFAVVKGFDMERRKLILNSGLYEDYEISTAVFERTWARADHWGVLALQPGSMPAEPEATPYFSALAAIEQDIAPALVNRAYVSGLQAWPTDRNLLMGYGNRLYAEKYAAAAAIQFGKVVALYPDYAPAHNNLANVLFEQGQQERALLHAREAVRLGGDYLENYRETLHMIDPNAE